MRMRRLIELSHGEGVLAPGLTYGCATHSREPLANGDCTSSRVGPGAATTPTSVDVRIPRDDDAGRTQTEPARTA